MGMKLNGGFDLSDSSIFAIFPLLDFSISFANGDEVTLSLVSSFELDVGDGAVHRLLASLEIASRGIPFVFPILYPPEVRLYLLVYFFPHYLFVVSGGT